MFDNYSGYGPRTVYLQGERNERTGEWEGNYPVEGIDWQMDERSGQMYAPDPYYVAPSKITPEDIKNRVPFSYDPYEGALVVDPNANVPTDPNEYSKQLGTELSKRSYDIWSINGDPSQYTNLIEGLKEVDPKAYYTAKLDTLSRNVGHQYQSNQGARGDVSKKELESLLPEAQKAGVTPEEINSIYGSGYSQGAQGFAQILQGQQSAGGPFTPLWEGIKFVGPGLLGMYGIDSALTAGLGAAYGAGTGMATTGIGSGLGGAAAMEGGALASGLGSLGGGGFGLTGASGAAGAMGSGSSLQLAPTYMGVGSGVGGGITAPSLAAGLGVGSGGVLGSGALSAESIAAMEAMNAGSGYGLNASQVPSLTSGLELGATQGLSTSDILSNVNRARSGANTLAKLIGGSSGSTAGTTGGTTGGVNTQQLASLLALPTQAAPGGLYRMNQNPFNFGTQGQTVASQGMYDVSGTNPMANALRKA